MNAGKLITFEGIDGAGKSTQVALLADWLIRHGADPVVTREPGGTPIGEKIRALLFDQSALHPLAEIFLFQSDRAQHFSDVVLPALRCGKTVISDRCYDSSIAYQGQSHYVGIIDDLSFYAMQSKSPDITFLLDIPIEYVPKRKQENRFDKQTDNFFMSASAAYQKLAEEHPARIKVIDATLSIDGVHEQVLSYIRPLSSL